MSVFPVDNEFSETPMTDDEAILKLKPIAVGNSAIKPILEEFLLEEFLIGIYQCYRQKGNSIEVSFERTLNSFAKVMNKSHESELNRKCI
jgi:hypothetical protein